MNTVKLKAEKRIILGRKVKTLRKQGIFPANIYGKAVKSQAIQLKLSDFEKVFREVGETGLVELVVGPKKVPVLVHNVQTDPVTDALIHADFLQVDLKEKVTAQVPVELTGESPAEKQGLGTVVKHVEEIEVEALPTDLPEKFEIDLSILTEVDQSISVGDMKVDKKKVEIKVEPERILVKVEPLRKEEEEEVPKEEAIEGEEGEAGETDVEKGEEGKDKAEEGKEVSKEEKKEP